MNVVRSFVYILFRFIHSSRYAKNSARSINKLLFPVEDIIFHREIE